MKTVCSVGKIVVLEFFFYIFFNYITISFSHFESDFNVTF